MQCANASPPENTCWCAKSAATGSMKRRACAVSFASRCPIPKPGGIYLLTSCRYSVPGCTARKPTVLITHIPGTLAYSLVWVLAPDETQPAPDDAVVLRRHHAVRSRQFRLRGLPCGNLPA